MPKLKYLLLIFNFIFPSFGTLRLVQMIFRHGISSPVNSYPTDPYKNDSFWPNGRGRLNQEGAERQIVLGRSIASRYKHFAGGGFNESDIQIISSDNLKTISSAKYFLAGLFGTNSTYTLYDDLIKIIPCEDDNIVDFCKKCSKYTQLLDEVLYQNSIRADMNSHRDVLRYMSSHSGLAVKTIDDFSELYSTLYYERFSNANLPDWVTTLFESGALDSIVEEISKLPTKTNQLKRLKAGPLIETVVSNMSKVVNELNQDFRNLQVFSGHASTLINLLDCLNMFDGHIPQFSSSIILELHQNPATMSFHIEVFSVADSGENNVFKKLWIPTCGFECAWDGFYRIINPYLILDFDLECRTATLPWNALLSAVILLAAFPILIVFFVKLLEKRRTEEEFPPLLNSHKIF